MPLSKKELDRLSSEGSTIKSSKTIGGVTLHYVQTAPNRSTVVSPIPKSKTSAT